MEEAAGTAKAKREGRGNPALRVSGENVDWKPISKWLWKNPERLQRAASELNALSTAAFDATDPAPLERFFRDLPTTIDHSWPAALRAPRRHGLHAGAPRRAVTTLDVRRERRLVEFSSLCDKAAIERGHRLNGDGAKHERDGGRSDR
jgi:hypothetical protein